MRHLDDPVQLKRNFEKSLQLVPTQIKDVEEGLEMLIDDDDLLKNALRPTVILNKDTRQARFTLDSLLIQYPHSRIVIGGNESLIRLLLGIEAFQPLLINKLLEKLPQFIADDG